MSKILNYTPHPVVIYRDDGEKPLFALESVGLCRVGQSADELPERFRLDGVPVFGKPVYGSCTWTPEPPEKQSKVLVSIVAAPVVVAERPDLRVYIPNQAPGQVVRNDAGEILGVRSLILWNGYATEPDGLVNVQRPYNPVNIGDGWDSMSSFPNTFQGTVEALAHAVELARGGQFIVIAVGKSLPALAFDGSAEVLFGGFKPTMSFPPPSEKE